MIKLAYQRVGAKLFLKRIFASAYNPITPVYERNQTNSM